MIQQISDKCLEVRAGWCQTLWNTSPIIEAAFEVYPHVLPAILMHESIVKTIFQINFPKPRCLRGYSEDDRFSGGVVYMPQRIVCHVNGGVGVSHIIENSDKL